MRILAVDYGLVRIGLALSDPTGLLAQGLSVLHRVSDKQAVSEIVKLVQQHGVAEIVVGLPRNMDGSVGERGQACQQFARRLEAAAGVPVHLYDERLTTVAAERMLIAADVGRRRRREVVDSVAATILLQGYLDYRARQPGRDSANRDESSGGEPV